MIIDISYHQGTIDWAAARKELDLVIMRASIGTSADTKYVDYATNCGIPYGVYHFLHAATPAEAEIEAKFFYETANSNGLKPLFYCADVEYKTLTTATTYDITKAFANTLRKLGAKKIGLYIGQSLYNYGARDLYDFIWIPRYGKNTGFADTNYAPIYPCDLWQYTSKGAISGINHDVDLDKLYGDKSLAWFLEGSEKQVSKTNESKFSNEKFVEFCRGFLGQPYWYGTCVYKCTEKLLNSKTAQYPDHYTSNRMSKYKKDIQDNLLCADCIGLN